MYKHLAITVDRFRVSYSATADIVNAALKDMGILNESNMLDRKKLKERGNVLGKRLSSE